MVKLWSQPISEDISKLLEMWVHLANLKKTITIALYVTVNKRQSINRPGSLDETSRIPLFPPGRKPQNKGLDSKDNSVMLRFIQYVNTVQ